MCHYTKKNNNKQEYNDTRKEINSSVHQKDLIPSYYHLDKKSVFIGGKYANENNPNKDDILHSSSDINHYFHVKIQYIQHH